MYSYVCDTAMRGLPKYTATPNSSHKRMAALGEEGEKSLHRVRGNFVIDTPTLGGDAPPTAGSRYAHGR